MIVVHRKATLKSHFDIYDFKKLQPVKWMSKHSPFACLATTNFSKPSGNGKSPSSPENDDFITIA